MAAASAAVFSFVSTVILVKLIDLTIGFAAVATILGAIGVWLWHGDHQ